MRYLAYIVIPALAALLLLSGCKNNAYTVQPDAEQPSNVEAAAKQQPLAEQPTLSPIKQAPSPFPDDGKTPSWRQSQKFPAYAYDDSSLPQQLYTYSLNQGIVNNYNITLVKPVDFYCQTSPAARAKLLEFFKDFVATYYTVDYRETGVWENNLRSFFDPKIPVTPVNGISPDTFIFEGTNNTLNNQLIITLAEILTDEALIYLDTNAHYRVRGRITIQAVASTDPKMPKGTHAFDMEIAFKKKLLSGPDNWATKDYVVTSVVKLR